MAQLDPREPTADYEQVAAQFDISDIAALLQGDLETGINACVECCDRHAATGALSLNWESADGRQGRFSFAEMKDLSSQFANAIVALGIKPGDVIAGPLARRLSNTG
jgi:acetyl-CoA synthetase